MAEVKRWALVAGGLVVALTVGGAATAASATDTVVAADDLEGACVTMRAYSGSGSIGYVKRHTNGYGFTSSSSRAEPFRFEATQLGRYVIRDSSGAPVYQSVIGWDMPGATYGSRADWTVTSQSGRYKLVSTETRQQMGSFFGSLGAGSATMAFATATGCSTIPDIATGVSGTAAAGIDANGKLYGWIDAHNHIVAKAAFGGSLHCGQPYAPGGVAVALSGCASHATLGPGAVLEALVGGTDVWNPNDDGWPTFGDWPRHNSQLHEQSYFRGIERAWRAGLREMNTLLVASRIICGLYPVHTSCDEMDQIRAQAEYLRSMQDYVDARSGGPGKGWFRLASTPAEVRSIAAQGKLAVVMGVENSELFGCREINGVAQCTTADIDAGLDELQRLGISSVHPVHKFDNAFGGTRFDQGLVGAVLNVANLASTGHWWTATRCTGPSDNEQVLVSDDIAKALSLGGFNLPAGTIAPIYPSGPICNTRGLTTLGAYLVRQLIKRGMIINIDHMGVKAATATLDLAEAAGYPGVVSAHSWADRAVVDRVLKLGGFVASYAFATEDTGNSAPTFLAEWRANRALANGKKITGYGIGTDVNGLAPQAPPRLNAASSPLVYPFTAPNGTTVTRQTFGSRTFDLNTDGVAQYGLYADLVQDLIQQAGSDGPVLRRQLMSSAEAYTAMWEKARG